MPKKKKKTRYTAHYVEPSILKELPKIRIPKGDIAAMQPTGNPEIYEKFGLDYIADFEEFKDKMGDYFQITSGHYDKNNVYSYEFTKYRKAKLTQFWTEYLMRDKAIAEGKYEDIRSEISRNNIFDAIDKIESTLPKKGSRRKRHKLHELRKDIRDLSNADLNKLWKAKPADATSSKERIFYLDLLYALADDDDFDSFENAIDTIYDSFKKAGIMDSVQKNHNARQERMRKLEDTLPSYPFQDNESYQEETKYHAAYSEWDGFSEKPSTKAFALRNAVLASRTKHGGASRYIKQSKAGYFYVPFKSKEESQRILEEYFKYYSDI